MPNSNEQPDKNPGGRPSKYKPEYVEQARRLCEHLAATEEELAAFFGVRRRTLLNWKHEHPEFAEATKLGKAVADARVVQSLYHRAVGYTHEAEKVFCEHGKVTRVRIKQHYPPDTAAGIWWTKNRIPLEWKERREESPGAGNDPVPSRVEVTVVDGRKRA